MRVAFAPCLPTSPRRNAMRALVLSTVAALLTGGLARGDELPDLNKISRTLRAEPAYTSTTPLYGVAAFGPRADKLVWMVLDKTGRDVEGYDVLHFDIGGKRERLTRDEDGRFRRKDFEDPAGIKHGDLTLRSE